MADVDGQEKTEQPTSKRLKDSREKGKVAKSMEVNSLAIFFTGLLMLYTMQNFLSNQISTYTKNIFSTLNTVTINKNFIQNFMKDNFFFFIVTCGPIFGVLFVVALIAGIAQVGFQINVKALLPDLSKFNPLTGLKKVMVSTRSLVEVAKSILKLIIISGFTYSILSDLIVKSTNLIELSTTEIVHFMVDSAFTMMWKISLVYVLIAAVDLFFQKKKFKKDMMMTKQEVKEENKQSEGDPLIKSRIRKVQFQRVKARMMQAIPKADVVVTNPTHYAIALKYEPIKGDAPKVVAKGVDELAQRIKEIARQHDVPIHENKELARALYKACDIGDSIPASLFKAVAQVLAYVYQLKNMKKKKSII